MRYVTSHGAWLLLVLCLAVFVRPGLAQTPSAAEGRRLAQVSCARCHVIVANGPGSWTDAPSFQAIANRKSTTQAGLTDFIVKPHMDMLDEKYTRPQVESIAAYILSLRKQ
jgi:mono/diheme cytochrome c family protein